MNALGLLQTVLSSYDEADLIKRVSPVAWQHINLRGRYQFKKQKHRLDLEKIIDSIGGLGIAELKDNLLFN